MSSSTVLILSLAAIVICIAASFFLKINMGIAAMACAFIIGCLFQGVSASTVYGYWADNLIFFMIASNLFFGYARENGTLDIFGRKILWLFRKKSGMVCWVFAFLAMLLGIMGAGPGTIVLLAPIAFVIAGQTGISTVLLAFAVNEGYSAGTMNPWTGTGVVLYGLVEESGILNYTGVYLLTYISMVIQKFLFIGVVWLFYKWYSRRGTGIKKSSAQAMEKPGSFNAVQKKTLALIVASFCLLVIPNVLNTLFTIQSPVFKAIVRLCKPHAVLIIFTLAADSIKLADTKKVISKIPMNTILTIAGVCFLMEIAKAAGLLDSVAAIFSHDAVPSFLLPALVCLLAGFMSLFSSGTSVVLPLLFPLVPVLAQSSGVNVVTLYAAAQIGALTTPFSPFSTAGSLMLGLAPDEEKDHLFRAQFIWALALLGLACLFTAFGYCSLFQLEPVYG